MSNKCVFVLGAGFSKPASGPLQSEILSEVFKLKDGQHGEFDKSIKEFLDEFESFLKKDLFIDESVFHKVALEDIFTPIDRCISEGISFRSHNTRDLVDLREKIYSLIIFAIKIKLEGDLDKRYIDIFADYLVRSMLPRCENTKHDVVSVISTNWDIILDKALKTAIANQSKYGVVDYCCYLSSLHEDETIKPGLWALGRKGFNVKLLKIHGSMNWLHCPMCQRLFVSFDDKIAALGILKSHRCKYCGDSNKNKKSSVLRSNLQMPTFLKDLNDFQIKLIWQNAGVELSEASRLVFIGYSLPFADFELRQLLSRTVSHDAEISVVMPDESGDPEQAFDNQLTLNRYQSFFGKRKIVSYPIGVKKFIEEEL